MFNWDWTRLFLKPSRLATPGLDLPPRIPNIFHFCYGLLPDAEFGFLEYLAIKSAYEINRPERIYLHYQHACRGPWWEKAKALVTLSQSEVPSEVHGRPLKHYAHRADVLRLNALREHGGIYLDIDTLCVRPFTALRVQQCVMGRQSKRGLCNAVILAEPQSAFISAWLESYRSFRSAGVDRYWDEHSVQIPGRLARQRQLRSQITILGPRAFFFPMWDDMHFLFESNDERAFQESYCIHYWESKTRDRWLRNITPEDVGERATNFSRFARRVL